MTAYHNEVDPFAAEWLRALERNGQIAPGVVDGRSIRRVRPEQVAGATQAHFFAGIGGWSHALRIAGWPDNEPVWTGSCPCQPFSSAGARGGTSDPRHLWPVWFNLIRECRPTVIFGEQVANAAGLAWFDVVSVDLEGAGYAVGAADLCAAGIGAPHRRQRLYWVAYADGRGRIELGPSRIHDHWASGDDAAGCVSSVSITGSDGRSRPCEPGTLPLAHGLPNRVGKLRGFGNAILPHLAAGFIRSSIEAIDNLSPRMPTPTGEALAFR
ncbi:MAG TPA: DNA cytosine methyltransferase [Nitrospira sp.]|nr:DNA cytosine methyltransferase [Nitrospira sp.]